MSCVAWTYRPETDDTWESWTMVDMDHELLTDSSGVSLYVYDRDATQRRWIVGLFSKEFGHLPYDLPVEELKAAAIALWRMA